MYTTHQSVSKNGRNLDSMPNLEQLIGLLADQSDANVLIVLVGDFNRARCSNYKLELPYISLPYVIWPRQRARPRSGRATLG